MRWGRGLRRIGSWLPGLLLVSPSILVIRVFVYGLIGWNTKVAMSGWHTVVSPQRFVGLENLAALWGEERWNGAVRNAVVFTVVSVGGAMLLGWVLALLLDKGMRGEGGFRAVFLSPWWCPSSPPASSGAGS